MPIQTRTRARSSANAITVTLPRPHAEQQRVIDEARRFNVVACGRRFGKTLLGLNRLVGPALAGQPVAWFSPTYPMLTEVWRAACETLVPVTARTSQQDHRLELITGGVIDMWSLERPDAARGRKYKRAVIDEAAMVRDLGDAWNAVIRPTLADLEGDAWLMSTPRGRNAFWRMFVAGLDPEEHEWASWQMSTHANPYIPPAEIEAMRETMPERTYEQEILARFLEDAGGVFRRVRHAATATEQTGAVDGHTYIIGADWGKTNDFSVFSVVDATLGAQVAMVRSNQVDYIVQMGRLRGLCDRFRPLAVLAESNAMGTPLIEQAHRDGLPVKPFTTTNASKAQIIDALALAFERDRLQILGDPVQVAELEAFEAERLPSGLMRYTAPEGMHDDTVMALALAWWGADRIRPTNRHASRPLVIGGTGRQSAVGPDGRMRR